MAKRPILYDQHGKPLSWGLYPSPRQDGLYRYRTRYQGSALRDTRDSLNQFDWRELLDYSRQIFAQFGDIAGGVREKNNWAFGAEGWRPKFCGKNKAWGEAAEEWLNDVALPSACLRGEPFDFQSATMALGIAIDVDGDQAFAFTEDENHFPKVDFISAHRINSHGDEEVKDGWASGAKLYNGVIQDRNKRTIGYRILNADGHVDLTTRNCSLLYEPVWNDQGRGIPRIATCLLDGWNLQDIDKFLQRKVKAESKQGIIRKTLGGTADVDPLQSGDSGSQLQTGAVLQDIKDSDMWELVAGEGEEITAFKTENPSANTEAFVKRITRRCLYVIGWPFELLDPSDIGGANTRLIIELAKQSITTRQRSGMKLWRRCVSYFVAKGMKEGFLLPNYDGDDAYQWYPELPAELTVDSGNDEQADRENMKMGTTNMSIICSKKGRDWKRIREQTQRETEDLIDRAVALEKQYTGKITFDKALELLSQRTPNGAPVTSPQEDPVPAKKK